MDYQQPAVVAPGLDYLPIIGTGLVQLKRAVRRPGQLEPGALVRVLTNLRQRRKELDE